MRRCAKFKFRGARVPLCIPLQSRACGPCGAFSYGPELIRFEYPKCFTNIAIRAYTLFSGRSDRGLALMSSSKASKQKETAAAVRGFGQRHGLRTNFPSGCQIPCRRRPRNLQGNERRWRRRRRRLTSSRRRKRATRPSPQPPPPVVGVYIRSPPPPPPSQKRSSVITIVE